MSLNTALLDQAFEDAQLGSEGDCNPQSIERIDSLLNTSSCPSPSLSSSDLNHTHSPVALQDELEDEVAAKLLDSKLFDGNSRCWKIMSREYDDNITLPLIPALLIELKVKTI
jgi:hypothetical protein